MLGELLVFIYLYDVGALVSAVPYKEMRVRQTRRVVFPALALS